MIVRFAETTDATAMAGLLNEIIRIGGTTAYEDEVSVEDMVHWYLSGPEAVCALVAMGDSILLGFQVLGLNDALPEGWGDIGTFVRAGVQRGGIGTAMFAATLSVARARGLSTINAAIRADNAPGLGFYNRRGFRDYDHDPSFTLKNGTRVGRVLKRFEVQPPAV